MSAAYLRSAGLASTRGRLLRRGGLAQVFFDRQQGGDQMQLSQKGGGET
jgi:hypothetical protein